MRLKISESSQVVVVSSAIESKITLKLPKAKETQ